MPVGSFIYNLTNQSIDEFVDNSKVDTGNSTNETLESGEYYGGIAGSLLVVIQQEVILTVAQHINFQNLHQAEHLQHIKICHRCFCSCGGGSGW